MRSRIVLLAVGMVVCLGVIAVLSPTAEKALGSLQASRQENLVVVIDAAEVAAGVLLALLLTPRPRRGDAAAVLLLHSVPAVVLGLPALFWLLWRGVGFPWYLLEHRQVEAIAAVWFGVSLVAALRAGKGAAQFGVGR